jgi:dynein heavy chain, axonemal
LKLDNYVREIEAQFPPVGTIYDYSIDPAKKDFELWEAKLPLFRYRRGMPFHKMIVPTVDTVRNGYVLKTLWRNKRHALLVGASGCGKTVLAHSELAHLPEKYAQLAINFRYLHFTVTT